MKIKKTIAFAKAMIISLRYCRVELEVMPYIEYLLRWLLFRHMFDTIKSL